MHTNRDVTLPDHGLAAELPGAVMNEARISLDTLGQIESIVSACVAGRIERASAFAGALAGKPAPSVKPAATREGSAAIVSIMQRSKPGPMAAPHSATLGQTGGQDRYYFQPSAEAAPAPAPETDSRKFDTDGLRADFPALHQEVNGKPLVWLDNAATTQKPNAVIDAVAEFYRSDNSNVHRAAHTLAKRATQAYESARIKVRDFVGARSEREIVFVRGTTEAINLVAYSYGGANLRRGDEILITTMEHHANILPWQLVAQQTGAILRAAPIDNNGQLLLDEFAAMLSPNTKLVAITQVSNVLGTVNPISVISGMVHAAGARLLVDGAQSVPHMPVDVQQLGCDFFVFSGHKLFGPTGIGALYGREELLASMPPWQGGGNMIDKVAIEKSTYNDIPHKFEAGTGNLADAVGLGAAIEYFSKIDMKSADAHERSLLRNATAAISTIPGLRVIGTADNKVSVLSFVADGVQAEDLADYLDREGIAVRAGHHCAQPTLARFGLEATVRASFAFYNTMREVERFANAVAAGVKVLRKSPTQTR
jgi:cysteine desulfurase/selenocysteine lyase